MNNLTNFIRIVLSQSKLAMEKGEIPIASVIVDPIDERIVGQQGSGMWPREPGHSSAWMRASDGRNHAGVPQHIAKRIKVDQQYVRLSTLKMCAPITDPTKVTRSVPSEVATVGLGCGHVLKIIRTAVAGSMG